MKKAILTFIIATLALSMQAQNINFDNGYLDRVKIDTANPNNIWQIGQPQKTMFDSAFSLPNVIVTDTLSFYPTNNNSVFYIYYPWHDLGWTPEVWFKYKIQTDTLLDFGYIEASYDNGNTWVDVMRDAEQYDIYWDVAYQDLGGGNYVVIASSNTDTLPFTGSSDTWYNFGMSMYGWDQYFPYEDTIIYKISFHSDGIDTGKEGWMIDDFATSGAYYNIDEYSSRPPQILAFPNPCTNKISFKLLKEGNTLEVLKIFKMDGTLVESIAASSEEIDVDVSYLPNGCYLFQTIDKKGETLSGKFLKK